MLQSYTGLGLRKDHYDHVLEAKPSLGFFEVISDNFMRTEGRPLQILKRVRRDYPIALHGVALNIASTDPIDKSYLQALKALAEKIEPWIVSDHLCWTGAHSKNNFDLLPIPHTEEALRHIVERVDEVQNFLGQALTLENTSTYLRFKADEMSELEFLREILARTGAGLLLDINNVYVNSINHDFDACEFIRELPADSVKQFHLAGHTDMGEFLFDTHDREVSEPVWDLYKYSLKVLGSKPFIIERDDQIPTFEELLREVRRAENFGELRTTA